jgi:hypothetical protein
MSHSLASRLHRFERASVAYLVLAYFVVAGLLATEWVKAVAAMGDGMLAPPDASALESGGVP